MVFFSEDKEGMAFKLRNTLKPQAFHFISSILRSLDNFRASTKR